MFLEEINRDSASEDDDGLSAEVPEWQELWDEEEQRRYWYNPLRSEVAYEEPIPQHVLERAIVGLRVRVFWPVQQQWFTGYITKWNKRKNKHR
jgi:hypothetical protein